MGRAITASCAVAIVLVVGLTACGSASPKARYVAKLNAMCEDFARREQKIGTPGSPSELGSRGDRIVAAYDEAILKPIQRLKAPPEIASQAAQLRELARRQRNVLGALANAGKAGDLQKIRQLVGINQQLNDQAGQVARGLKADSCAS